jgi:hypothetical protein
MEPLLKRGKTGLTEDDSELSDPDPEWARNIEEEFRLMPAKYADHLCSLVKHDRIVTAQYGGSITMHVQARQAIKFGEVWKGKWDKDDLEGYWNVEVVDGRPSGHPNQVGYSLKSTKDMTMASPLNIALTC